MSNSRDSFKSTWGFILASVGSAVGCCNIWRFPIMVSVYGGLTYIIPYLIFVVLVANTGIMEEFALGRFGGAGPVGAFGKAMEKGGKSKSLGELIGAIPVLGSLGLAIGYTCVFGWIVKYTVMGFSGELYAMGTDMATIGGTFDVVAGAMGNNLFIVIAIAVAAIIMLFGIANGIEKANKVLMPALFAMLVALAIYVATLPGASEGYKYIFTFNGKGLADPKVWIYAFGMAFFSLSVAGNGSVIYGSYLNENEDIPFSAVRVAVFDTIASMLATLVIIPAMASAGISPSKGGPGLIFVYLTNVLNGMKGGRIIGTLFFVLFTFAALSSILNLYEVSVAFLQEKLKFNRKLATVVMLAIGAAVAIFIQAICSPWMDVVNNYICPFGALLAAIMFYWVCGEDFALEQINMGAKKPIGKFRIKLGKYAFCIAAIVALVAGVALGGIG